MIAITSETGQRMAQGLRPMEPARDLGTIARLITDAFAHEIDERGQAALREMRWMARLSPLVWWWTRADPSFSSTFSGFVWEEPSPSGRGNEVVGNASLNRAPGSSKRWVVCNVVVLDEYRGQGIGRHLIEASVAEAWELGAQEVVLQVYQDNRSALKLYTDLGFREAGGEVDFRLEPVRSVTLFDAPDYEIRPWQPADGRAAWELVQRATPEALQWLRPLRVDRFQPDLWQRAGKQLADLVTGQRARRMVALKDRQIAAMLTVSAALRGGHHRLALVIAPEHAGRIEAALVSRALYVLAAVPNRMVQITVDKAQTAASDALRSYGFEEHRTLLTLCKRQGQG